MAGRVSASNRVYEVIVKREAGFWVGVVQGVPGGATETRTLAGLEAEVRDLLAGLLDIDEDELHLRLQLSPALSPDTAQSLEAYRHSRAALQAAQRDYDHDQADIVRELRADQVSLRDAAYLTGMSFQRVQQLERADPVVTTS